MFVFLRALYNPRSSSLCHWDVKGISCTRMALLLQGFCEHKPLQAARRNNTPFWRQKHKVGKTPTPSNHFPSGCLVNILFED